MEEKIRNIKDKQVIVNYYNRKIAIDFEEQKRIDDYWKSVSNIFTRGDIFVVEKVDEKKDKIEIDTAYSDYAHYIYVRRNPGMAKECYSMWAGALLETLDNKYVIGEMSKITSTLGEYHISGGSCDKNDLEDNTINYKKTMYRELEEELGLNKNELEDVQAKYMKNAFFEEQDIGIIYKAIVKMTSTELEKFYKNYLEKLKKENGEIEFNKLVFIDKNEDKIRKFCLSNKVPEYTLELLLKDVSEK